VRDYSIGDLARRTGLAVRTIRFYSDSGVLPPIGRDAAGYRRYSLEAVARLDLIRTLRELGVDLPTVRRVVDQEVSVAEVAAAHVEALDVQIRTLRLRRAVLRAVARGEDQSRGVELMHKLVGLSEAERHRIIHEFIDDTFGRVDANPELVELLRQSLPDLPDDPEPEQVDAWVQLTELVQDPDFRAGVRRAAEYQAAERARGDQTGLHHELTAHVRDRVEEALAAGIGPASPAAGDVVDDLARRYGEVFGDVDTSEFRAWMLTRIQVGGDPRVEQYWQLLAVINGWPPPPSLAPVFAWFAEALQRHPAPQPQVL
jgi:DNA-binding transcriptional MerR regulator